MLKNCFLGKPVNFFKEWAKNWIPKKIHSTRYANNKTHSYIILTNILSQKEFMATYSLVEYLQIHRVTSVSGSKKPTPQQC